MGKFDLKQHIKDEQRKKVEKVIKKIYDERMERCGKVKKEE